LSRPRNKWWGYAEKVIRAYPENKRIIDNLSETGTTATVSGMPRSGRVGDPVHDAVIRLTSSQEYLEFCAVHKAVETTKRLPDGAQRLALIEKVEWRKTHTLYGAASAIGWHYATAKLKRQDFVRLVGKNMGLKESLANKAKKM